MIDGYPLPDGADPDDLSWLDYRRYEADIKPGTPTAGYRIMRRDKDHLYPAFTKRYDFEHSLDHPNHSPTERGYNYWVDLNVALHYAERLAKEAPLPPDQSYDIHHVTGIEAPRSFDHREGNVMDDMMISPDVIARFTND